ncbi:hypothetical protein HA402_014212 [Bradysia odoriphaga]|nr:hypothetical protein HA402_014212 [Bradysia odoriphaga]
MSYFDQEGEQRAYEAYQYYLYQRRQEEIMQVQLKNQKENSELTGRYIAFFTIIIVLIGLIARFLYCKCDKDNRQISCRSDFRNRQPFEFTEVELSDFRSRQPLEFTEVESVELVNEQPIRTLNRNPNPSTVQIPPINRATVSRPTAPSLSNIPGNLLNPSINNEQTSQDLPPSYDDCVKNVRVMPDYVVNT